MISDRRCPNHRCNRLLFRAEGTTVHVKCPRCKEIRKFTLQALSTAWST